MLLMSIPSSTTSRYTVGIPGVRGAMDQRHAAMRPELLEQRRILCEACAHLVAPAGDARQANISSRSRSIFVAPALEQVHGEGLVAAAQRDLIRRAAAAAHARRVHVNTVPDQEPDPFEMMVPNCGGQLLGEQLGGVVDCSGMRAYQSPPAS